jgi:hypothetical protein
MVKLYAPNDSILDQGRVDDLARDGLFGDDIESLQSAWRNLSELWDATIERAGALPAASLDERVNGEWSFIETMRHVVFVVDIWIGQVVEERPSPFHPWSLPPHFMAGHADAFGVQLDARPGLQEVVGLKRERDAAVEQVLAALTPEELLRTCAPRGGQFQVVGALQTVVFETWAHLQFATRDLKVLESGAGPPDDRS